MRLSTAALFVVFGPLGTVLLSAGLLRAEAAWAQSNRSRVTGRIVTADTQEPLLGASVTARTPADSSLVTDAARRSAPMA